LAETGLAVIERDAAERAARRLMEQAREALPPELAYLADGLMAEAVVKAVEFARHSVSETTEKIYADDWSAFRAWCAERKAPALPAHPVVVASYLSECSERMGRSGLRLILAAIGFYHRRTGHPWVSGDPTISTVMRSILRKQQRPVRPAAALASDEIIKLLEICRPAKGIEPSLADLRDRALLLTCFAGALRRSELVALDVEDMKITKDGVKLKIRRSKADQLGDGTEVLISNGSRAATCPAEAMRAWLKASAITYGPVFRRITAAGAIEGRLTGNGVWRIVRRRAEQAALTVDDSERLSPHGMRAGYIVEAYLNGGLDEQVQDHARQKSIMTTRRYRKRAKTIAASPTKLLNL
jgi:site-specific recombinase XerD